MGCFCLRKNILITFDHFHILFYSSMFFFNSRFGFYFVSVLLPFLFDACKLLPFSYFPHQNIFSTQSFFYELISECAAGSDSVSIVFQQIFECCTKAVARCMKRIERWVAMPMWRHAHRHVDCSRRIPFAPATITHTRIHFRRFARPAVCNMCAKKLVVPAEIRYRRAVKKYAKCKNHWKPHPSPNVPSFWLAAAICAPIDPNIISIARDHTIDVGLLIRLALLFALPLPINRLIFRVFFSFFEIIFFSNIFYILENIKKNMIFQEKLLRESWTKI